MELPPPADDDAERNQIEWLSWSVVLAALDADGRPSAYLDDLATGQIAVPYHPSRQRLGCPGQAEADPLSSCSLAASLSFDYAALQPQCPGLLEAVRLHLEPAPGRASCLLRHAVAAVGAAGEKSGLQAALAAFAAATELGLALSAAPDFPALLAAPQGPAAAALLLLAAGYETAHRRTRLGEAALQDARRLLQGLDVPAAAAVLPEFLQPGGGGWEQRPVRVLLGEAAAALVQQAAGGADPGWVAALPALAALHKLSRARGPRGDTAILTESDSDDSKITV